MPLILMNDNLLYFSVNFHPSSQSPLHNRASSYSEFRFGKTGAVFFFSKAPGKYLIVSNLASTSKS